jgi:hypothetical protein
MCLDPDKGVFAGRVKPGAMTFDGEIRSVRRDGNIIFITFKDVASLDVDSTPKGPKVQQYSEFDVLMVGVAQAQPSEVVLEPAS